MLCEERKEKSSGGPCESRQMEKDSQARWRDRDESRQACRGSERGGCEARRAGTSWFADVAESRGAVIAKTFVGRSGAANIQEAISGGDFRRRFQEAISGGDFVLAQEFEVTLPFLVPPLAESFPAVECRAHAERA